MKMAIVLACLASCSVNRDVLEGEVTDCAGALDGVNGQSCSLDMTCSQASDCCNDTAYCRGGTLVVSHDCNPDCTACTVDMDCTFGAAICENQHCVPCESACPTVVCPAAWIHLRRNGCAACECAPAATCSAAGAVCATGICYRGKVCAAGCLSTTPTCCSNQCEAAGCPMPVPTGCLMTCPAVLAPPCTTCAADHCECVGGQWQCTAVCAPGLLSSCFVPDS